MVTTRTKQKAKEQRINRDRMRWGRTVWHGHTEGKNSVKLIERKQRKIFFDERHKNDEKR